MRNESRHPEPVDTLLPPPAGERFFKIRNRTTGKYKLAGLPKDDSPNSGWGRVGKCWDKKALMGHLALFIRSNTHEKVWTGTKWEKGPLKYPELAEGATYYAIPAEYEIVEYFALGTVVNLKNVMHAVLAKGSTIIHPPAKKPQKSR